MEFILIVRGADLDIKKICEAHSQIKNYAFILHNKEAFINPHYHIYLHLTGPVIGLHQIAEWFDSSRTYIIHTCRSVKDNLDDMLVSLSNVYSLTDIVANFDIYKYLNSNNL